MGGDGEGGDIIVVTLSRYVNCVLWGGLGSRRRGK